MVYQNEEERECYYFADQFADIRSAYIEHVKSMFDLVGIENSTIAAEKVMSIEKSLADKHWKKEENRDMYKIFNKYVITLPR